MTVSTNPRREVHLDFTDPNYSTVGFQFRMTWTSEFDDSPFADNLDEFAETLRDFLRTKYADNTITGTAVRIHDASESVYP